MNISPEDIRTSQRSREGLAYESYAAKLKDKLHNDRAFRKDVAANFLRSMERSGYSPNAVHQDRFLSNLSIGYRNDNYIGLQLMPVVPVQHRSDKILTWDKRNALAAPEDQVASRGVPNEIEEGTSEINYSVKDYSLIGFVDSMTAANADEAYMDLIDQTESLAERLALKEEMRIATILTTGANYGGNTVALTGTEWNEGGVAANTPINDIQAAMAAQWAGRGRTRNIGFTSLTVLNWLSNHSQISDRLKYTSGGLTTRQQLAMFFGLDDLLVGEARKDTANSGQAASYSRIWGDVFGIVRVMSAPSKRTAAFGATFRFAPGSQATQWFDPKPGAIGGTYSKVSLSEDHKVLAADTGYLLTSVLV